MPQRAATSRARSGPLHLDSGTPDSAGSAQASATTSARSAAVNTGGRPLRGASVSPASRPFPRTGGATCGPYRCTPPARRRSRRCPGRPPRRARSRPAAGPGRPAHRPGPGRQHGLLAAGQDNLVWAWHGMRSIRRTAVLYAVPAPVPQQRPRWHSRQEKMTAVARYPDSTKTSLEQRLRARARERWPQIASLQIRHRGTFSYVDATLTDATTLKLCRLRYVGSGQPMAVRDLPRQPRRLRRIGLLHRPARRHLPRRPRHRLRPLPQRPHRLDPTPDELTGATTKLGV